MLSLYGKLYQEVTIAALYTVRDRTLTEHLIYSLSLLHHH